MTELFQGISTLKTKINVKIGQSKSCKYIYLFF